MNREHVLERLSQVSLPANLVSADGHGLEPRGPDLLVHRGEHKSPYDVMERKALEDWTLEKAFKSVPGVVDVSSFGGPTKEYQVISTPTNWLRMG